MSIRIRVAVGYGLDLTGLNKDFVSQYENLEDEKLFEDFMQKSLKSADERDDSLDRMAIAFQAGTTSKNAPRAFADMIEWDEEFALEDKMLLFPAGYKNSWMRQSDTLDSFIWEAYFDPNDAESMTTAWKEKPGTLYPFIGLMRANPDKPLGVETYWENCYLNKDEHKDAAPMAPLHLWHLIKHLKLTETDEQTTAAFLSLRPHFMRWWS